MSNKHSATYWLKKAQKALENKIAFLIACEAESAHAAFLDAKGEGFSRDMRISIKALTRLMLGSNGHGADFQGTLAMAEEDLPEWISGCFSVVCIRGRFRLSPNKASIIESACSQFNQNWE